VIVYGDSFVTQGAAYLASGITTPGWRVLIRQFPGTALCDFLPDMEGSDAGLNARVVVIAFVGNMITNCTQGRGSQFAVYTADAATTAALWASRGVQVLWASPPGDVNLNPAPDHPLTAIYQATATAHGQAFVNAGQTLRDVDGSWPPTLPCLTSEISGGQCPAGGRIQVRFSAANGHLCLVDSGLNPCPVYSSGIVRWDGAIVSSTTALTSAPLHTVTGG
jgi:hypothetical protein